MVKKEICIISNDKFKVNNKNIIAPEKNTISIIDAFNKFYIVYLIARKTNNKNLFVSKNKKIVFFSTLQFIKEIKLFRNKKFLFISITPYNFMMILILKIFGFKTENITSYLISDGFKEYKTKFGYIGYLIYYLMFSIFKNFSKIITCSNHITKLKYNSCVYPSTINSEWLKNRKIDKKLKINKIKLLYIGRFRKEKGYKSLINIFLDLKGNYFLSMLGAKYNLLNKKKNIRIIKKISNISKIINIIDKHHILILPSYTEGYPQVILESFARLKPVIIFEEIEFIKDIFTNGIFACKRNSKDFKTLVDSIIKNYTEHQKKIKSCRILSIIDFQKDLRKYF